MYSHPGSSKQGTYDVPNLKPEAGLAEWTSKIKAMQRQVDADEEAEQKRLEEEIATARLARSRRNQGVGYGGRANNVGVSIPKDYPSSSGVGTSGIIHTTTERRDKQGNIPGSPPAGGPSTKAPVSSVSLASLIGGRVAGPKLSRQTSQQPGHDISLFQRPDSHSGFGKGRVAMPGMDQHDTKVTESDQGGSGAHKQDRSEHIHSFQTINATFTEAVTNQPQGHTSQRPDFLDSTITLPPVQPSARSVEKSLMYRRPEKPSTTNTFDSKQDHDTPAHNLNVPFSKVVTQFDSSRRFSDGISSTIPRGPPVTTNSLARPISPRTRVSLSLPQSPTSQIPSPAFIRHPLQKDPTPSISRLQGRGFVQNMVKVSTQLESPPAPSGRISGNGLASGLRRASVLDRWPKNDPPQMLPPLSLGTGPIRGPFTADSKVGNPEHLPTSSNKPLKPATSFPALRPVRADAAIPIQSYNKQDGLGSATTLLVYKPKLTTPSQSTDADELGFQRKVPGPVTAKNGREPLSPSGSPLSHLTKDRARKPRKARHSGSKLPIETPGLIQPLELRSNVQLPPTLPHSSVSNDAQQIPSVIPTIPNIVSSISNATPIPTQVLSLPDAPEGRSFPPPQTENTLAPTTTDPLITTLHEAKEENRILSPQSSKYSRIPSSGNRATVMDVAQALYDQSSQQTMNSTEKINGTGSNSKLLRPMNLSQLVIFPPINTNEEKHKSSYEKYSSIILPPLKEETTPLPSPAGTLTHAPASIRGQHFVNSFPQAVSSPIPHEHPQIGTYQFQSFDEYTRCPDFPSDDFTALQMASIDIILNSYQPLVTCSPVTQNISVDVMIITGNIATSLSREESIFYDTELLVIIDRSKSLESGLVSTVMWAWYGKRCTLGEREKRKLQELARRYGITAVRIISVSPIVRISYYAMKRVVPQDSEQPDLVHALGGRLGTRTHWTPENTAMHLIRSKGGVLFINEHDLDIRYLCSAFSYCLSILDTLYVWYGRGSTLQEQKAALDYARSLKPDSPTIELSEDEIDDDEMFWLILGNREYANADYWKWRKSSLVIDPHIWRVNATPDVPILPVNSFSEEREICSSVYIIDCIWELYILVGRDARNQKHSIMLALKITSELSLRVAPERPFTPTVHILLLPTQLPRDLRANLRGLNEQSLDNGSDIPNHMNLLSFMEASTYVQSTTWNQVVSQGHPILPLDVLP
ncbi:hypothetical protein BDZ94DRAFT_1303627 [Collybia nuda]|uniref:Gelsolin n=1 Tax=Collybia nuda TaxID=64659 RepID=A0A9P5YJC1_9AGAR|nr:hypothetical protein BDZ94DRAFT_1303627 [Collybia nuda]